MEYLGKRIYIYLGKRIKIIISFFTYTLTTPLKTDVWGFHTKQFSDFLWTPTKYPIV